MYRNRFLVSVVLAGALLALQAPMAHAGLLQGSATFSPGTQTAGGTWNLPVGKPITITGTCGVGPASSLSGDVRQQIGADLISVSTFSGTAEASGSFGPIAFTILSSVPSGTLLYVGVACYDSSNTYIPDSGIYYTAVAVSDAGQPSLNSDSSKYWAGYAAEGSSIQYAHGQWTVSQVDCASIAQSKIVVKPGFKGKVFGMLSEWVGIGGFRTTDLLQAGVQIRCDSAKAKPTYEAFWEALPSSPQVVKGARVRPGDAISVDIRFKGPSDPRYVLSLKVNGALAFSQAGTYRRTSWSSAECIVEDSQNAATIPGYLPFPRFGSIAFRSCTALTAGMTAPKEIGLGSTDGYSAYRIQNNKDGDHALTSLPDAAGKNWIVNWVATA